MRQIKRKYSTDYLTLVSIVQSAIFAFWLTKFGEFIGTLFDLESDISIDTLPYLGLAARYLCIFLMILIVWHEYLMGTSMFTAVPVLRDSITPFLLAILEYMLIVSLNKPYSPYLWFLLLALFWLSGAWAYAYKRSRVRQFSENELVLMLLPRLFSSNILWCFVGVIVFGTIYVLLNVSSVLLPWVSCLSIIFSVLFLIRGVYFWNAINTKLDHILERNNRLAP